MVFPTVNARVRHGADIACRLASGPARGQGPAGEQLHQVRDRPPEWRKGMTVFLLAVRVGEGH